MMVWFSDPASYKQVKNADYKPDFVVFLQKTLDSREISGKTGEFPLFCTK